MNLGRTCNLVSFLLERLFFGIAWLRCVTLHLVRHTPRLSVPLFRQAFGVLACWSGMEPAGPEGKKSSPGSWRAGGKARRSVSVLYKVISRHGLCACRPRVGQCRPGLRKPRLSGGLCGAPSRKTRCSSAYVPQTNFRSPRGVE